MKIKILVICILLWSMSAYSACTDNGDGTFTTDGNESADLQECIALAGTGETINVVAGDGAAVWTPFTLSKSIKIVGPGQNEDKSYKLDITWAGTEPLVTTSVDNFRISGFSFSTSSAQTGISISDASGWRIDHNRFYNSHASTIGTFVITGVNTNDAVMKGVVDNNYLYFSRVLVSNNGAELEIGGYIWNGDLGLGSDDAVYIEDNICESPMVNPTSALDANRGGKYVFRYNTVVEGHAAVHSLQAATQRATRKWEIYGNTFNSTSVFTYAANLLRGGTGVIFGNDYSSSVDYNYPIMFDNVRSTWVENSPNPGDHTSTTDGSGICGGDHTWDGNTIGGQGYPCRDQIGRSSDATLWIDGSAPSPAQALSPAYVWSVYEDAAAVGVYVSTAERNRTHIQADRDYYDYNTSFNGTSGTGCGALTQAQLNSTYPSCTDGVAYWSTSQNNCADLTGYIGDSTQRTSGTETYLQGTLYKCSSNTWTAYYTPYTYPHPLRNEDAGGDPITYYTLTVTQPANGTITNADNTIVCGSGGSLCSKSCLSSASEVLTFTADDGYYMSAITGCSSSPCTLAMSEARAVTATFTNGRVATIGAGGTVTIGTGGTVTLQ